VPFVYLANPTGQVVGPYATTAVFGASNWKAPNWMGTPVQWCGLVYADALYWLERDDRSGPWKRIADGITASGVQQTWPSGSDASRVGLLPDSFALRAQMRNDPAINPATLLADAMRLYNAPTVYDFRALRGFAPAPPLVHAPGAIEVVGAKPGRAEFRVLPWTQDAYYVLIAGLRAAPRVLVGGKPAPLGVPNEWHPDIGRLVLRLHGTAVVRLEQP
jgi:hypothetical protein